MNKAIFLDRDGTINADEGYTHRKEDWHFLPGVIEALKLFKNFNYLLVIISNQSGIGRGYYTESQLHRLEIWVSQILDKQGASINAWYHCPHLPDANCSCRKPRPGMLLQAAKDLHISPPYSYMLGDKLSDVEAGLAAGCHAGLISSDLAILIPPGVNRWPNLLAAAEAITNGKICAPI